MDQAAARLVERRDLLKLVGGAAAAATLLPPAAAIGHMRPRRGGSLKHIGVEPPTFDPQATVAYQTQLMSSFVRRTLFKFVNGASYGPSDFTLVPDLATRAAVSKDGRVYTITLRKGVRSWSCILPPEVEDRMGDFKRAESLLGCGPFVLERYEPGLKAVFARNPRYYGKGLPYLDRVEWLFVKDRATQLSLYRAGQVDVPFHDARVPRADVGSFKRSNPAYPVVVWDWLANRTLAFRTDKAPWSDPRVRQAFSLAIDRKKWVAQHLEGQGWEDPGPVPAPMREWKLPTRELGDGAMWLQHNPALAKKMLADAGFPNGMRVKCTNWPGYGADYVEELELLAGSLKHIGVELSIVNEEYGNYIRGSFLGKFDEVSWGPSSLFSEVDGYLFNFFRTGQPNNRSHVSDAQLDVLLDAQRRYTARSSRKKIIDDIQQHAAAQVYYVYTPYPKNVSSWAPRVKNYGCKNCLDRGAQLEVVWLEK